MRGLAPGPTVSTKKLLSGSPGSRIVSPAVLPPRFRAANVVMLSPPAALRSLWQPRHFLTRIGATWPWKETRSDGEGSPAKTFRTGRYGVCNDQNTEENRTSSDHCRPAEADGELKIRGETVTGTLHQASSLVWQIDERFVSVVEQEFLAGQDGPVEVLDGLASGGRRRLGVA